MIARFLSIAAPCAAIITFVLLVWGVYRERKRIDAAALILAVIAFAASFILQPFEHRLFFDEDIYIQIASNFSHAPASQLILLGNPGDIAASTYYKEPSGFPMLLGIAFLLTGASETIAFVVARVFFALAVAAVYLLARQMLPSRSQAIIAAAVFAGAPSGFAFSGAAATDFPAALFATLGIWGAIAGNGMLAAAGLAMAAQTRLELFALVPLIFLSQRAGIRWKACTAAMAAVQAIHLYWVMSVAPILASAERIESIFALAYIPDNFVTNVAYVLHPLVYPAAAGLFAAVALVMKMKDAGQRMEWVLPAAWIVILFAVYVMFYAGSFERNPRYSIQIAAPLAIFAASLSPRRAAILLLAGSIALAHLRPFVIPDAVRTLAAEHNIALRFGNQMTSEDLVIATEPEVFLNGGWNAMNAIYASERPDRLQQQFEQYRRIYYFSGSRTQSNGTPEHAAAERLRDMLHLRLIESRQVAGFRLALYEASLKPLNGQARVGGAFK